MVSVAVVTGSTTGAFEFSFFVYIRKERLPVLHSVFHDLEVIIQLSFWSESSVTPYFHFPSSPLQYTLYQPYLLSNWSIFQQDTSNVARFLRSALVALLFLTRRWHNHRSLS